jgi:hypothetical protein
MNDGPQDPFISQDVQVLVKGMYEIYAACIAAGFPEPRAFEIVRDITVTQFSVAIQKAQRK